MAGGGRTGTRNKGSQTGWLISNSNVSLMVLEHSRSLLKAVFWAGDDHLLAVASAGWEQKEEASL